MDTTINLQNRNVIFKLSEPAKIRNSQRARGGFHANTPIIKLDTEYNKRNCIKINIKKRPFL